MPSSPHQETSIQPGKAGQPTARITPLQGSTRTTPSAPSVRRGTHHRQENLPHPTEETSIAPGGTSSGTGLIAPGSEGIAIGSGGSPSGTGGTSSGAGGAPTGTKGGSPGSGGTPTGKKGGSSGSERDDFSGVEIPSYVIDAAGFRSSHRRWRHLPGN